MKNFLLSLIALTSSLTAMAQTSSPPQNTVFVAANGDLGPAQQRILEGIQKQPMTADVKTVRINTAAFDMPNVTFNMPQGYSIAARSASREKTDGTTEWIGDLSEDSDSATFVIRGQNVTGTVHFKDKLFSVKPLGGGLHAVVEQAPDRFPPEHPPTHDERKDASTESVPTIDVLVIYTPETRKAVADIVGLIELAIKETNESYDNSGIKLRVALAAHKEIDYAESGDFYKDVDVLSDTDDGVIDQVHAWRNTTKADIVVMLVNTDSYCGIADAINAKPGEGFALVYHGCATGYFSFAHEIGHLQGARHDPDADPTTHPFPHGHGFVLPQSRVRTVMAYSSSKCGGGGCKRIACWSAPGRACLTHTLGNAAESDNARVLKETAQTISTFR